MKNILLLLLSTFAFGQNYETHSYGEHPQQVYDVYFPSSYDADTPVVIFLHGGSWHATHRQRSYYRSFVEDLFNAGNNIVVNADYRLLVQGTESYVFPDQIDDVQSIINHVKDNYSLHDNSFTLSGNSAGGHLALWHYLNNDDIEKVVFITAPYDGSAPYGNRIYFNARVPLWIRQQFVNPNMGVEDIISYASPSTYANIEKDNIFSVWARRDHEVPYSQRERMLEDYPNMRNITYDTSHSGWLNRTFRYDLIAEMIDFIGEENEEEECTVPTNVTLTRISHTRAKFEGANPNFHYQGSANRAGRPLRPYPMYGMNDMTVPHIQERLVPAFDYDVWLRTICGDGTYSDWTEAHYLPRFEGAKSRGDYYNINGVFMGNDYEQLPRGYYIKNNGQESIKIYKK